MVINEIGNYFPNYLGKAEIKVVEMYKVNQMKHALLISFENSKSNIIPTLYLEDLYDMYESEDDKGLVLDKIVELYIKALDEAPELNLEFSNDKLFFQLINAETNRELISKCPHRMICDMAVIYRHKFDCGSTIVTNEMINYLKLDEEELYKLAYKNTKDLLGVQSMKIEEMLKKLMPAELLEMIPEEELFPEELSLHVLTNNDTYYGASTILYTDILDKKAEEFGENFYIIPSSIHEVLLLPVSLGEFFDDGFIELINSNELMPEDVLSNHRYIYDRKSKQISIFDSNAAVA